MTKKTLPLLAVLVLVLSGGCLRPSYQYRHAGGGGGGGGGGDSAGGETVSETRALSVQSARSHHWRGARYGSPGRAPASPSPSYSRRSRYSRYSGVPKEADDRAPAPVMAGMAAGAAGHRGAPGATTPSDPAPGQVADGRATGAESGGGAKGTDGAGQAVATSAKVPLGRLIIYRGAILLQVIQLNDAMEAAQKLALGMGAYLQSRANAQLAFRVPVEKFQELLKALESLGEVADKSIHADDVTQQYYDIEVRLKAAETILARLKALLAQAKNVEESLAIEKEMGRLLEVIERFKGTLRYLRHHASLSTLTITFRVRPLYSQPIQSQWRSPFHWVQGLGLWRMMSH